MAGQFDLRYEGDEALGGVVHERAQVCGRVEALVHAGFDRGERSVSALSRLAAGADLGEPRIPGHLVPPPLVVGEVQVQHVQMVGGEQVDEAADVVGRAEVPRDVEHRSAPAVRRFAVPGTGGDARGSAVGNPLGRAELHERHRGAEDSDGCGTGQLDTVGGDVDAERFFAAETLVDPQHDLHGVSGVAEPQLLAQDRRGAGQCLRCGDRGAALEQERRCLLIDHGVDVRHRGAVRGRRHPQHPTRRCRRDLAVCHDRDAVDEHLHDAERRCMRTVMRRCGCDRRRIEEHEVGGRPFADHAARSVTAVETEPSGRRRRAELNDLLQAQRIGLERCHLRQMDLASTPLSDHAAERLELRSECLRFQSVSQSAGHAEGPSIQRCPEQRAHALELVGRRRSGLVPDDHLPQVLQRHEGGNVHRCRGVGRSEQIVLPDDLGGHPLPKFRLRVRGPRGEGAARVHVDESRREHEPVRIDLDSSRRDVQRALVVRVDDRNDQSPLDGDVGTVSVSAGAIEDRRVAVDAHTTGRCLLRAQKHVDSVISRGI